MGVLALLGLIRFLGWLLGTSGTPHRTKLSHSHAMSGAVSKEPVAYHSPSPLLPSAAHGRPLSHFPPTAWRGCDVATTLRAFVSLRFHSSAVPRPTLVRWVQPSPIVDTPPREASPRERTPTLPPVARAPPHPLWGLPPVVTALDCVLTPAVLDRWPSTDLVVTNRPSPTLLRRRTPKFDAPSASGHLTIQAAQRALRSRTYGRGADVPTHREPPLA